MINDKVYILVLNYNGWQHTVECLESLLKLRYTNRQIVVLDNNSSDNSVEYVRSWAEGKLNVWVSEDKPLRKLSLPTFNHALPYVYYGRHEAERGGNAAAEKTMEQAATRQTMEHCVFPLVIVQTGGNLGFAGGNNVGIRYALNKGDADYIWLINNDTVVRDDTLTHLVEKTKESAKTGAVGSVHLDYVRPDIVQTIGGSVNLKYFGITKSVSKDEAYSTQLIEAPDTARKVDFISGCSLLISKEVVTRVGLLDDNYFVYWEDADWSERIKRNGFILTYSMKSVVYHKKSQSSSFYVSSYYSTLNCFRFYRRYYTSLLPLIFINRLLFVVLVGCKNRSAGYVKGSLRAYVDFIRTIFQGYGSL